MGVVVYAFAFEGVFTLTKNPQERVTPKNA
ncbi:hypothetical protein BDD21_2311 [Thiocapsa rosea]|uniref:Uncharacterized protein n=1 Tax=Thiocapsa rosea TaxID=69360 RepID=A0A495V965_9GAMM|nr:hypothetical protein BDD21_2311 [Thiocapsa rosea]